MTRACIEVHYLPSIAYMQALLNTDEIILESQEHYLKQTFRNRCYINTEHGLDRLVVPLTGKHGKVLTREVRIDYRQKWVNNHWRTIKSAYGKAPWFEHYAPDLHDTLYTKHELLYDLNLQLLTLCLNWLGVEKKIMQTFAYEKHLEDGISDLRNAIIPKSGLGKKSLGRIVPYQQVFGRTFATNLSVIDLLFCTGPEAIALLKQMGDPD